MWLGIPIVVHMFTLNPLIDYLVSVYVYGVPGSFWEIYADEIGGYGRYGLGVGPLWYVAVLLVFAVIYAVWRRLVDWRATSSPAVAPATADSVAPGNVAIAIFALALGLATFIVRI